MEKATRSILVIEDDKATLNKIKNQLKELNYKVACVMTAQEGVDYCIKNIVDLILLDLGLPDKDGMYVIETVRSFNNTLPIIVVSGRTTTESSMDELLARIRKELRNTYTEEKHLFINGNLTIDYDAKTIFVNGVEVHFTNFEFKIVTLLANNLGKTLAYDYIINHVWGKDGQDQNGLRVFMAGIRKKISRDPKSAKLIRTDIGSGYRMNKIN